MLLAHVSDTHLGYRQYNLDERENDFSRVFEEFVDKVIEDHVEVVIHSGDFFDSFKPSVKALYTAKKQLARLNERGIKVYTVLGDHDFPKRGGMPPHMLFEDGLTLLGVKKGGEIRRGCVIESDGKEVYVGGVTNMTIRYKNVLLDELSKLMAEGSRYRKSVVVMHQALDVYMGYDFQLTLNEIPVGASYYAMGHLHGRRKMTLGNGVLAYAGSTEITRRDEIEEWRRNGKGFYLVDLSGSEIDVQPVSLEVRPQFEVEVSYDSLKEDVMRALEEFMGKDKPVVHVRVRGSGINRRAALEVLDEALSGRVLIWRPEFREEDEREYTPSWRALSHKELLKELLGGDVAEFAWELFRLLKGEKEDVEEAKRFVDKFFREGSW